MKRRLRAASQMKHAKVKDVGRLLADGKLIARVMRTAVREALLQHKHAGNPVAEWRDGKVVWIPPEEIRVPGGNRKRCRATSQPRMNAG